MARTEGRNQPDLLSFLHKRDGSAPAAPSAGTARAPVPPSTNPLSRSSHPILAGGPPSRLTGSRPPLRKEVLVLGALALLVLGVTGALIWRAYSKPVEPAVPARPGTAPAAANNGGHPGPAPAHPAAAPSTEWTPPVAVAGTGAKGTKTFWTLTLCAFKPDQEAAARKTCQQLRARGKDFSDAFLYRAKDHVEVCLGHFDADRNALNNPKVAALNKQLNRDYPKMQTVKITVLQP